ncbi:uncharacterized protein LOC117175568 [Belonocnema kinseyi]|uniref:uncharacterized protein LOC117175568 n=1 Tax=Belonocnema kinseyi TaxID=2817044 RepID=UPI00143CDCC0|nr:uncharacterized protein LOC117175568 [Belonocnema kinseyi]
MTVVLQGNLNRCKLAQALMAQLAIDKGADIFINSEQYDQSRGAGWFQDTSGTAAIWVINSTQFPVHKHGVGDGYVWVTSGRVTIVSCYLSPNAGKAVFHEKLETIGDLCRGLDSEIILAGDFNAKSCEWGMTWTDRRGREVSDMAAMLELTILNNGNSTTFRRAGQRESILDITMATPVIARNVKNWQVLAEYTASDHQYIYFDIDSENQRMKFYNSQKSKGGWNVAKLDAATLANREYLLAKKTLNWAINASKHEKWVEVRLSVDTDTWGLRYQISRPCRQGKCGSRNRSSLH